MDPANDAQADTVREYLTALLQALWTEGEGFSGKRPLGNSDWQFDLYAPLIDGGLVTGDDEGCPDREDIAVDLITAAIEALGANPEPVGYVLVRADGDDLHADWDGDVHPSLAAAEAVLPTANAPADEDDEGEYRIVALVDLDPA
jgi:hypothetical protein